jgi:hypothetical protein
MNGFNRYLAATTALLAAAAVNSAAFGQAPGKSVWDGVYADAQSKRGESLEEELRDVPRRRLKGSDLAPAAGRRLQGHGPAGRPLSCLRKSDDDAR